MSNEVEILMDDMSTVQLNGVALYLVACAEANVISEEQVELLMFVSLELYRRRNRLLMGLIGAPVDEPHEERQVH